jgi:tetratricopeptide (TPR) repeat protein
MMVERHYDDEALVALLHSGDEAARDAHLSACRACAETLESYRAIAEVLGEQAVWDLSEPSEESAARGVASLRAVAAEMESEDVRAERLVDEMLKFPRQWWTSTVLSDERYQMTGFVRRLISVSEAKLDTMPPDAVELAAAAIAVTEIIDGGEPLQQLRGAAYRQHAYALFYVGDFNHALESVERAEQIFRQCTVSEYALARLNIVRSLIYSMQGRNEESLSLARSAAEVFRSFGDKQRFVSARMSEVYLLIQMHSFRQALPLLFEIKQENWNDIDVDTRARLMGNIGSCQWNVGQTAEAVQSIQFASELFDELGNRSESVRLRESLGALLIVNGKYDEAKKRLTQVQAEYASLGMLFPVVTVGLELAEIAVLENDYQEVERLCRTAIRQFEAAGTPHSSDALTALTYLREAAEQRRATQEIVWHVKTYIRRLPDEPALLFAPAPLPPG